MDQGNVELIAEGASLGDSLSLTVKPPDRGSSIGTKSIFTLVVKNEKEEEPPVGLRFSRGELFDNCRERWDGKTIDGSTVEFLVDLIPRGDKGDRITRFMLKGEKFGATLAIAEVEHHTGPPVLNVEMNDGPLEWDGRDRKILDYTLTGPSKTPGRAYVSLQILNDDGRTLWEGERERIPIDEKASRTAKVGPLTGSPEGGLTVRFILEYDGEERVLDFERYLVPDIYPVNDVMIPTDIEPGSTFEIMIGAGMIDPGEEPLLRIDEMEIRPGKVVITEEGSMKVIYDFPIVDRGEHSLAIIGGGEILTSRIVRINGNGPGVKVMVECEPKIVPPGGSVGIIVDVSPADQVDGMNVVIDFDHGIKDRIELGSIGPDGHLEKEIRIPGRANGDIGGRISLMKDGETFMSEVYTRILSARSEFSLPVDIILPAGSSDADGEDTDSYLFPGERISMRSYHSDVEVARTDLGRTIVLADGVPVPAENGDIEAPSRAIILESFIDAMGSPRAVKELTAAFKKTAKIAELVGEKVDKGILAGETGFTGSLARYMKEGNGDPSLKIHSRDEKDPVSNLSLLLKELTGSQGVCVSGDPAGSLRSLVERTIKETKSRDGRIDRALASDVLEEISRRGESSLKRFMKHTGTGKMDTEEVLKSLRSVLFYLLSHSLVRIEVMSRWSHPVVTVWEELRLARQRAIKTSIQTAMDTVRVISDIHNAALQRWEAYVTNLGRRRVLRSISRLEINKNPERISGIAGSEWNMNMIITLPGDSVPVRFTPYLRLPRGGWSLEYPRSLREGSLVALDDIGIGPGERRELELRISSPPNVGENDRILIYLYSGEMDLEEEP